MNFIRPDFLFSYWVFAWFVIYYFFPTGIPDKYSPKLALFCALAENLFEFVSIILFNRPIWDILKYLAMIAIVKVFPLYLLRKESIHFQQDICVLVAVFAAYLLYLAAWGTNLVEVYRKTEQDLKTGQNNTPLYAFFRELST
jgi:hypothetical protein